MRGRMRGFISCVFVAAAATFLSAAPPTVTAPPKVYCESSGWAQVKATTTDGKGVKFVPLSPELKLFPGKLADPTEAWVGASRPGIYKLLVYTGSADGPSEPVYVEVTVGTPPAPIPPGPTPPDPPTPEPPAPVVKSFRVIFVLESGSTPTAAQNSVMNAKVVRDYLNAKCTKEDGRAGWRQFDPQQVTTDEQPTMKALWAAVSPKLTALPCIAIEVNGKVEIVTFPATPAAAILVLDKYLTGGK